MLADKKYWLLFNAVCVLGLLNVLYCRHPMNSFENVTCYWTTVLSKPCIINIHHNLENDGSSNVCMYVCMSSNMFPKPGNEHTQNTVILVEIMAKPETSKTQVTTNQNYSLTIIDFYKRIRILYITSCFAF